MSRTYSTTCCLLVLIAWSSFVVKAFGEAPRNPVPKTKLPNLIVILADDLGYGDLSTYGGWIETPHIDRLAKEGVRWTDFHSNGSVCSPTRAALMTGRYQQRAGIPGVVLADPQGKTHEDGIQEIEWTLAEALKEQGYATGLFGKWHLGYLPPFNPTHHGFDTFRGYVSGNVDYHSHIDQAGAEDWWFDKELHAEEGYSTHLITQHAVQFIQENHERPFFALIAHEAPHYPFQGPDDEPLREAGNPKNIQGDRKDKKAAYTEMVAEMDRGVGEILAAVDEAGIDNQTLIWFLSDNGAAAQGSNRPWRGRKGTFWEGGHRVPSLCRWPGTVLAGSECTQLAMTADLMPTFLELAGRSKLPVRSFDGISLSRWLQVKNASQLDASTARQMHWNGTAMRDDQWKLMIRKNQGSQVVELYDLATDPGETKDVSEAHPQKVEEMLKSIEQWKQSVAAHATHQPSQNSAATEQKQ